MKYCIQIVTCNVKNTSKPSLLLIHESQKYLFNVGENTQRFFNDKSIKTSKIQTIFLSRLHMDTVGGLPGMLMTLADGSTTNLNLLGPCGLTHYLAATQAFLFRKTLKVQVTEAFRSSSEVFKDDNLLVLVYHLYSSLMSDDTIREIENEYLKQNSRKKRTINEMFACDSVPMNESEDLDYQDKQIESDKTALCFLCQGPNIPGKFDSKKATALGVPHSTLRKELVMGNSITLPSGALISPHQVVGPELVGSIFAIIDVPSIDYLDSFLSNQALKDACSTSINPPKLIYHFSSRALVEDERYMDWINGSNPKCKHVFVGSGFEQDLNVFEFSKDFISTLHDIEPEFFPSQQQHTPRPLLNMKDGKRFEIGIPTQAYEMAPTFKKKPLPPPTFHLSLDSKLTSHVDGLKQKLKSVVPLNYNDEFLVSLGTGSSKPSRFRNVSGTFFYHPSGSILFDVGEGTLNQLSLVFKNTLNHYLSSLRILFISHMHGDHQLGAFSVIQSWCKANKDTQKLYVVAPKPFYFWMKDYSALESYGYERCLFIDCASFQDTKTGHEALQMIDDVKLASFETVSVNHCKLSYAVSVQYRDGFKVSFSGDCRPSMDFAKIGSSSDLLIHEATFEDCLIEDALKKRHCTYTEALQVAQKMKAKNVLLTHFSQRVSKCPHIILEAEYLFNVGLALDLMKVSMKNFNKLPLLNNELLSRYFGNELEVESD